MPTPKDKEIVIRKLNKKIKNNITKSLPSKQKLKQAQTLPPSQRKRFFKKIAISFAKGVTLAAGVAVTFGIIYGLSRKTIHNELRSGVKVVADETSKQAPVLREVLENQATISINNLDPIIQQKTRNVVNAASEQAVGDLKKYQDDINEAASQAASAATKGTGGILGVLSGTGGGNTKKEIKNPGKNIMQGIDKNNIIPGSTDKTLTRSATKNNIIDNIDNAPEIKSHPLTLREKLDPKLHGVKPGIQEVEFGKRTFFGKKSSLKILYKDLKIIKKIK